MKIFLSWSGELSHVIALAFAEWIQDMLHTTEAFLSSNIDKGLQWPGELASELEDTNYGVTFLTRENLHRDYILFEAGALSKLKRGRVSIVLVDLKNSDLLPPLAHFQSTKLEKNDLFKLVEGINREANELTPPALEKTFAQWWGNFDEQVQNALKNSKAKPDEQQTIVKRPQEEILEEILQNTRDLDTTLRQQALHLADEAEYTGLRIFPEASQNRRAKRILDFLYSLDIAVPISHLADVMDAGEVETGQVLDSLIQLKFVDYKRLNLVRHYSISTLGRRIVGYWIH